MSTSSDLQLKTSTENHALTVMYGYVIKCSEIAVYITQGTNSKKTIETSSLGGQILRIYIWWKSMKTNSNLMRYQADKTRKIKLIFTGFRERGFSLTIAKDFKLPYLLSWIQL